ncbi:MAG TPA: hypothetical protein VFM54_07290 [Micromonosporaceae bacterium]|nr:hypothetical protein [Micromonosporaceae bacterium]
MTVRHVELRPGTYRDSVRLMQVSDRLRRVTGVDTALVAMATPLNVDLAGSMGFAVPAGAAPDDLLVAVAAAGPPAVSAALDALDALLAEPPPQARAPLPGVAPRTVGSAVRRFGAGLALVSTPGRYAFLDAMDALDAGASVMLFSDNVPVAQEVRLKDVAAARGLLVLGPDCGTAVVGGVGLGFANVVRPGPVGLVAASGTGAQQVMTLLDAAGVGVSHCLGVGGRDLSAAVAGRGTLAALDALDADEATGLIVLVTKPPAAAVADAVRARAAALRTPVVLGLPGAAGGDLTAVVEQVLHRLGRPVPAWPAWHPASPARPRAGCLRGLFAGGTLCAEALALAAAALGAVRSNLPGAPQWTDGGHCLLDLGADELTEGRPHPMIDGSARLARLAADVADASCGVLLLDVVLGHGAHPDPAAGLAPALAAAREQGVAAVVSLIGTAGDPQGLDGQAKALCDAGAAVFASNAAAARHAVGLARGSGGGP